MKRAIWVFLLVIIWVNVWGTDDSSPERFFRHAEPATVTVEADSVSYTLALSSYKGLSPAEGVPRGPSQAYDLTINNVGTADIEINWLKTMYIYNNEARGTFMLRDEPFSDREIMRPNGMVLAGGKQTYTIIPKESCWYNLDHRWTVLPVSEGDTGVYLSVIKGGKESRVKVILHVLRGK